MLEVAKILKPCGLKGEVKCAPYTMDSLFWNKVKDVSIDGKIFSIKSVRLYKGFVYLSLDSIHSLEEADTLRGKEIFADENLISKDIGEYLIDELVSCVVCGDSGEEYGMVESVEKYGSADIINIKKGGAIYSFPFLKNLVIDVDISNKKIIVLSSKMAEVLI